ncbi:nuclear transport factor 2 family protein [Yinghuangia seranimata]|uniref:nuclear transport factor 2 family protein n=1 Tax=Yinghuangia seranimata TaxID=408067 RepID=UPI00248CD442|nr:nuclear transport factor 2 family protein [Yinghuangia seranimata]MDI2126810.1 nuclear transport factor 2 family protein [Yinghuangia seranimata]
MSRPTTGAADDRYARGLARQAELGGPGAARAQAYDALADIAPDLRRLALEFAYGDIHARPGLDAGRRELVVLGALIALGGVEPQLEAHLGSALGAGLTAPALVEAILQALPYAGFPRVFAAMGVARRVFAERGLLPVAASSHDAPCPPKTPCSEETSVSRPAHPDTDRNAVVDLASRMMHLIDTRDWERLGDVFADRVLLDYTSLFGGEPEELAPTAIVANWSALLGAFDATQHLLANQLVSVDGDQGELTAAFQATHRLANPFGSPLWTLGGTYRVGVVRVADTWRVDRLVMTATWADGNKDLLALATASAAAA